MKYRDSWRIIRFLDFCPKFRNWRRGTLASPTRHEFWHFWQRQRRLYHACFCARSPTWRISGLTNYRINSASDHGWKWWNFSHLWHWIGSLSGKFLSRSFFCSSVVVVWRIVSQAYRGMRRISRALQDFPFGIPFGIFDRCGTRFERFLAIGNMKARLRVISSEPWKLSMAERSAVYEYLMRVSMDKNPERKNFCLIFFIFTHEHC